MRKSPDPSRNGSGSARLSLKRVTLGNSSALSTTVPESTALSFLPAHIEMYGNHNTINSACGVYYLQRDYQNGAF